MEVIPAIDLIGGKVVRLTQGDYTAETSYGIEPGAAAARFAAAGATRLHVVDLDGARVGAPVHLGLVAAIARGTGLDIEFGGGLRTREAIGQALAAGAGRVIVGTAAWRDQELMLWMARTHPARVAVALDIQDGRLAVAGWKESGVLTTAEAVAMLAALGITQAVFTDIEGDGTLQGLNFDRVGTVVRLCGGAGIRLTLAGGVRDLEDIRGVKRFAAEGLEAVVAGKALYEGTLDLAAALAVARAA